MVTVKLQIHPRVSWGVGELAHPQRNRHGQHSAACTVLRTGAGAALLGMMGKSQGCQDPSKWCRSSGHHGGRAERQCPPPCLTADPDEL
jgi:hypothetical protein